MPKPSPEKSFRKGAVVTTVREEVAALPDISAPRHAGAARERPREGGPIVTTRMKLVAAVIGALLVGSAAYGATNWVLGLNAGSSGEARAATVSNLSIVAVATPAAGNVLYPGATGDVVATITNPNAFPVTVTAVNLPANTTYAPGYVTSALTTTQTGCSATTSEVSWSYATTTSGSSHSLTTALTVGANSQLTVTLTNDATMASTSPVACENTFFSMPSLAGVSASGAAGSATASPATDSWTS